MYEVNVLGTLHMTQALLPALTAGGDGTVVVLSSTAGHGTYEGGAGYVAAKNGARVLAETLRLEIVGTPVRVIEIAPGMVKTDEFATTRFRGDTDKAAKVYAGVADPLTADDVAETITWACTRPRTSTSTSWSSAPAPRPPTPRSTGSRRTAKGAGAHGTGPPVPGSGTPEAERPRGTIQPFTQMSCFSFATTSTRSRCWSITFSIGLYAPGISSTTPESLRHSTPRVCSSRSRVVKRRFAALRLIFRPAPCEAELKNATFPRPFTMYEPVPIEPGMIPNSPEPARIAPFRVTSRSMPSYRSSAT